MLILDIKKVGTDIFSNSNGESAMMEILLMLLVAFILGWFMRHFFGKDKVVETNHNNEWETKYNGVQGEVSGLNTKISGLSADISGLKNSKSKLQLELDACRAEKENMSFASVVPPADPDDLKKIEGIGPKIEEHLNNAGVYTWVQLAETKVSFIQKVLDDAGPAYKVHNPGSWPEQSKMAAEGKWAELKIWQDELIGGK